MGACIRPQHPEPQGEHSVGCIRGRLPVSKERQESEKGLFVQVTYPADRGGAPLDVDAFPWFRPEVVDHLPEMSGCKGRCMLGGGRQVDASQAPKKGSWPIIIFSSGLFGSCEMYTQLCRELASAGYIVVAADHEDGSGSYAVSRRTGAPITFIKDNHKVALERRAEEWQSMTESVIGAAQGTLGGGSPISQVLMQGNPDQLIIVAHSFGCAGVLRYVRRTLEASQALPYQSALLLDPWLWPLKDQDMEQELPVPFTVMESGEWLKKEGVTPRAWQLLKARCCLAGIAVTGTLHQWISEVNFFGPEGLLRRTGALGTAPRDTAHRATIGAALLALETLRNPSAQVNGEGKRLAEKMVTVDPKLLVELKEETI